MTIASSQTGSSTANANGSTSQDKTDPHRKVTIRERLSHLTWAWFTFPQSTGGIAILLDRTPNRFAGLETIGVAVFILNLIIFSSLTTAMITRFILFPEKLKKSFIHPPECYFFPSFWLSIATIIGCAQIYGVAHCGPWLIVTIRVVFWIYCSITLFQSFVGYIIFAINTPFTALTTNPLPLLFNTLCAMLAGTIASVIAPDQPPEQRLPIIVAGVAMQGLGYMVSLMILTLYFFHILQQGLPPATMRPAMAIAVGIGGFTIVAVIELANAIPTGYGYFAAHPTGKEILLVVSLWLSVFIWIFTFWTFALAAVGTLWGIRHMSFSLTSWALVFPNVGFTLGTIAIGEELDSPAIKWVTTAMTILLVFFWLLLIALSVKAVITKKIMWPGKDEDKES